MLRGFLARRSRKKSSVRKVPKFPSMFNTVSFGAELRTDLEENGSQIVRKMYPMSVNHTSKYLKSPEWMVILGIESSYDMSKRDSKF